MLLALEFCSINKMAAINFWFDIEFLVNGMKALWHFATWRLVFVSCVFVQWLRSNLFKSFGNESAWLPSVGNRPIRFLVFGLLLTEFSSIIKLNVFPLHLNRKKTILIRQNNIVDLITLIQWLRIRNLQDSYNFT